MKLRTKLIGAFAALLALLLISSGMSIFYMNMMRLQTESFGQSLLPGTILVKDVHRGIYGYHTALGRWVATEARDVDAQSEVVALRTEVTTKLEHLTSIAGDQHSQDLVSRLQKTWRTYVALAARIENLLSVNDSQVARQLLEGDGFVILANADEIMQGVDAYLAAATKVGTGNVAKRQQQALSMSITLLALAVILTIGMGWWVIRSILGRVRELQSAFARIGEGDLTAVIPSDGKDELAQLARDFNGVASGLCEVFHHLHQSVDELRQSGTELAGGFERTAGRARAQQIEMDAVATAMNEMTATVREVARSTDNAAGVAGEADVRAREGQRQIEASSHAMRQLSERVGQVSQKIHEVSISSKEIGAVIDVISGVAEQTNLLALNAAIEAARAGEQGRGFAVVADEVRTLASRTQESTRKITEVIERLQQSASSAVDVASAAVKQSEATAISSEATAEALRSIMAGITQISELNTGIATSAEEQSRVAEEMDSNIVHIHDASRATLEETEQALHTSGSLKKLAEGLAVHLRRYRY